MQERNIFLNLSPLDHRYYLSNQEEHENLAKYLSEEATIRYCIKIELALLSELIELTQKEKCEAVLFKEQLEQVGDAIDPQEVYAEEAKTQHNIRALVNVLKRKVPPALARFVHLGATSVDILDTALSLRIRDAIRQVVLPIMLELEEALIEVVEKEAQTVQVGRTHGQFAVPITFGFAMAEYVSRLGKTIERIEAKSKDLRGKLTGAVGAYNATSMITADPAGFEARVMARLGLKSSEHATQLVEPEYLLSLLVELNIAFGIIANLADDLRHLQRSEIAEIQEEFSAHQVGSSTMPQKRNPWNCEHVKSLWKAFCPRVVTFFMDQISEHQRDLTNSASQRFVCEYIAGFTFACKRMLKIIRSLRVNREKMKANLKAAGSFLLAEPAYILLALGGDNDAHETIRQLTLEAERSDLEFIDVLKKNETVWQILESQLKQVNQLSALEFFSKPENYVGLASQKATDLSLKYREICKRIKEAL